MVETEGGRLKILGVGPEAIGTAASILRSGGIVLYPTETFYALGAMPSIEGAVEKIYEIKGRDGRKPLPLIASDIDAILSVASEWPEAAGTLARSFWPGPLSLIVPAGPHLPAVVHAGTGKVAVRISSNEVASLLARDCGGLIVSTSANLAGEPPAASAGDAGAGLLASVEAVLDAGNLPGGLPSTVVDVAVHPAKLVRPGKISWDDILFALEHKLDPGNGRLGKDRRVHLSEVHLPGTRR